MLTPPVLLVPAVYQLMLQVLVLLLELALAAWLQHLLLLLQLLALQCW
jgi:hypothetical protein